MEIAYIAVDESINATLAKYPRPAWALSPPWWVTYVIIMGFLSVSGTVGNVLLLVTIFRNKRLHRTWCVFVVSLALADMCVTVVIDPAAITGVLLGEERFAAIPQICEVIGSLCVTSCIFSMFNITQLSVNRYVRICFPMRYAGIYTRKNCILLATASLCVAFLADVPAFSDSVGHCFDQKLQMCMVSRSASLAYTIFLSTM